MPDSEHRLRLVTPSFSLLNFHRASHTLASDVHVRTDSYSSPTSISTGLSFSQEKDSYIQIQIQFITTLYASVSIRDKKILNW